MTDAITRGIRVKSKVTYLEEDSCPEEKLYVFAYNITISNHSDVTVQLLTRHWIITDADGQKEEVQGPGVVGQQPVIQPGQSFQYSSFCPLKTPVGMMHGSYQMVTSQNESFDAVIAPFTLAVPGSLQ
jgi:ApaG protein